VAPMGSGAIPIRDKPAQVEVVAADASPGAEGIRTNEAEPWLEDVIDGDASALEPLGAGVLGFGGEWPLFKPTWECHLG
jgi:hypothetical protein